MPMNWLRFGGNRYLGQGARNFAAAQAAGANINALGRNAGHYAHILHVGSPLPVALAVGVAHLMAAHRGLFANFTKLSHR